MDQETMGLRVLAHFTPGERAIERMAAETDWLDVRWVPEDDDDALYRELPEAEVIWHWLRPLSRSDLEKAPKLKLIHKLGAGVNTIDVETATERGVVVANMPGANAASVAECTVMLMLATQRRLPELHRATRAGKGWPTDPKLGDQVRDVGSCTVGLIGFGSIGKRVEQILRSMGTRVVHTSTKRDEHSISWLPLKELLETSDIVSIHAPLNSRTEGLIDADALAKMKPGAVLINTARGQIVDQDALVAALSSGRLAAAGLDVFAEEPLRPDNPLLGLDNVVLMPHVGAVTADTMDRYFDAALKNCRRLSEGKPLYYVVNEQPQTAAATS